MLSKSIAYKILIGLFFSCSGVPALYAAGNYYIGQDEAGVYLQTDMYGSWYIGRDIAAAFKLGEKGSYKTGVDHAGNFILIGKRQKFYTDLEARESIARQTRENDRYLDRSGNRVETTIIVRNNQILLPVILGYQSREINALLLLDTGASMTVLHHDIAQTLSLQHMTPSVMFSAEGRPIASSLAKLDYIKIGSLKKENVLVSIIEHKDPSIDRQGLLGMNILRDFEYQVDFKRKKIIWRNDGPTTSR
ncbi:MAG: retropepsin-like aspartic protease [Desulfobacterales bacterium]